MCKLFCGETSTYHYSTEENRVILGSTPFCILGSTQLARMDQGHGLGGRCYLGRTSLTKSKKPELISRIACALHVFNHSLEQLLMCIPLSQLSNTISRTLLQNTTSYVSHLETQKDILSQ
ncbi:hypothetical protein P5673_012850, partial [Acropora cervicornis]